MSVNERQNEIIEEFALFDEWMDKYEYLISLGKELDPMPPELKTEEHLIRGCQSKVWLYAEYREGKIYFRAESDAFVSRGLIALLVSIFSGREPQEILNARLYFPEMTGLSNHLSPSRSNGLNSMIGKIREYAAS